MQCAACGNGQNTSTRGSCGLPWSPERAARAAVARLEQPNLVQQHRVLYVPRVLPVPSHPHPGHPCLPTAFLLLSTCNQQGLGASAQLSNSCLRRRGSKCLQCPMGPDMIRPQHNTGGKRHKTINSWLLDLALGKGRCTIEREETGTDRGWDVLQEPQGRQRWLPTPQTQGCSPTGEGSGSSWAEQRGKPLLQDLV